MKTLWDIHMVWGPSSQNPMLRTRIHIPKGTRVRPCDRGQFFVDDLSWIPSTQSILRHDAEHYGIRLDAEQVGS